MTHLSHFARKLLGFCKFEKQDKMLNMQAIPEPFFAGKDSNWIFENNMNKTNICEKDRYKNTQKQTCLQKYNELITKLSLIVQLS